MKSADEVLYEFDLYGYAVLEGALDTDTVQCLNSFWDASLSHSSLNDIDFGWGADWAALIDNPRVFEVMSIIYSGRFRLDHMFCVDERFVSSDGALHHHSDMFDQGIFYSVSNGKIHCGLSAVQFALRDIGADTNHFCCIPGSHRANFPTPLRYQDLKSCDPLVHVTLRAGDALIFSEALVHGTFSVKESNTRRAVFGRYTNSYSYYRRPPEHLEISALPPTPNHGSGFIAQVLPGNLSNRQRYLVMEPAYARSRPAFSPD